MKPRINLVTLGVTNMPGSGGRDLPGASARIQPP